jgi:hypothetical protein
MDKYYVVYDMSPLEKAGAQKVDWIQMAFGFKNEKNIIREQQYVSGSPNYEPEPKGMDQSIAEAGYDAYDNT